MLLKLMLWTANKNYCSECQSWNAWEANGRSWTENKRCFVFIRHVIYQTAMNMVRRGFRLFCRKRSHITFKDDLKSSIIKQTRLYQDVFHLMMQKWLTTNNWHWQLSPRMRWNMSAELQTCTKDHTNQNLDKENKLNKLTWTEFLCTSEEVTMHLVGSGGYWTEEIKFRQIGIEHHAIQESWRVDLVEC